jgi:hypothetical protein
VALVDNAWYVNFGDGSTTGYYAVTKWATGVTKTVGALIRQNAAPAVGSERVFICVASTSGTGTTNATTEPTWTLTRGAKTTDNTVLTWQECTGIAAINGDKTNTPSWAQVLGTAITQGQVIQNVAGTIYLMCTTSGTAGSGAEPSWAAYTTAGATTIDNGATWTNIGVVGNFTGWQAPHARLSNAVGTNWAQAGNSIFVGDNHAETTSSAATPAFPGTNALPNRIYCVNHSGSLPPVAADLRTTATISTTAAASWQIFGSFVMDGFTINVGNSVTGVTFAIAQGAADVQRFRNCALQVGSTGVTTVKFGAAGNDALIELENTTLQFGNTADSITLACRLRWRNTPSAITGATIPTGPLFNAVSGGRAVTLKIEDVDLSALGSGKTIVGSVGGTYAIFKECKVGASVAFVNAFTTPVAFDVDIINCDSGATNYRNERYRYAGTETTETTIIRTGGASDGVTPISRKIVTTANSQWDFPFVAMPMVIWNDTVGSPVTATIFGIWGGGAVPNNDDIWIEAEYLGSASSPLGSIVTATKANGLAVGSALTTDTSTWGGSTTKFAMSVTFTPQARGYLYLYVKAAKVSTTFYVDPKPALS